MNSSLEGIEEVEGRSKDLQSFSPSKMSKDPRDPIRVPSYDDLTPGIPDVLDSESVNQLALFLREDLKRNAPSTDPSTTKRDPSTSSNLSPPSSERQATLYACLRQTADGERQTDILRTIARDFSPRVMRVSEQEILLDVSGLGRLIGEPPAIGAALTRAIVGAGLANAARVAIAPTQTVARLMATQLPDYPITRLPDLAVAFLRPLETLPPAINHRDRARPYETFERWGIATLGDLAALPAAELSSRLGRRGVTLQRLARGLDLRPFVPDADTPRYIGRLELEWPLDTLEPLSFVFARLLEPLSAALERADRGAAAIRLDLRLTSRETLTRVLQLPAPMRDPKVLRTLLLLDLESGPAHGRASEGRREPPRSGGPTLRQAQGRPEQGRRMSAQRGGGGAPPSEVMIDIVSIELDPAPARITQFSLLERAMPSPETLSTLTARLSALVGESRVGSAVLLDSHRPDAFEMRRYAPELMPDLKVGPTGETVGPTGGSMLRRRRHPPAIRVRVEHGRPAYLAAARRGMPQGAVTQAAGPWRTSGGWWGLPPQGGSYGIASWNRDEWDVALASGPICRIFQDRTTDRWFLEAIYD
jgi:protein ImuB